jgi:hypothetical protein
MFHRRAILGVILCSLAAAAAQAQPPVYRPNPRGDIFIQWAYPNGDSVGQDCFGNCGKGCDDEWNPCGGRQQFWVQEMLDDPQFSHMEGASSCDHTTGTQYFYDVFVYTAPVQETYNGFVTEACILHDITCGPGLQFAGCLWPPHAFCPYNRHDDQWSWITTRPGRKYELSYVQECGCQCLGDYICSC